MRLATLLSCLLVSTSLLAQVPSNGLVVHFDFNGNHTENQSGVEGEPNNVTFTEGADGTTDGAALFNGSNSYIAFPEEFMNGNDAVTASTFMIRFRADDLSMEQGLWNKDGNWRENRIRIYPDGHIDLAWAYPNYYDGVGSSAGVITEGAWHTAVFLLDQNSGQIFIDGEETGYQYEVENSTISFLENSPCPADIRCNRFGMVRWGGAPSRFFNGAIDEFAIWNRALSDAEIYLVFNTSQEGCTDTEACNYSESANEDNGSCVYPPLLELGSNTNLCAGESLELSVDAPGLSTTWSTGATGGNLTVTETGTYSVQIGGEFGADYRLEFDGVDDYVSFGSSMNITTYPFSIQADVQVPSDYWPLLYTDDGTDGYSGIWFNLGPEFMEIAVGEGSGGGPGDRRSKKASHGLIPGDFANVSAVVRGATDMSLFVNGVGIGGAYSGSGNTNFVDNGLDAVTGRFTPSSGPLQNQIQYYDGSVDNLHVWTKALTTEEVVQYAEAPATGDENGLLAVYTFDEGAGNTAVDDAQGFEASLFGDLTWVLKEAGCSASDTITVNFIDCESLCGPGTTWDPILQSCVADTPDAAAAENCSLFTLQELSSGYLLQQGQLDLQDTLIIGLQQQVDSLNALLNNCPGND